MQFLMNDRFDRFFAREIPSAASVPMVVAIKDELTAKISEFFKAVNASSSSKSSLYQSSVNSLKLLRFPDSLNENRMTTKIGAYKIKKISAM